MKGALGRFYLWEFVPNFTDPFTLLPDDCAMKSLSMIRSLCSSFS